MDHSGEHVSGIADEPPDPPCGSDEGSDHRKRKWDAVPLPLQRGRGGIHLPVLRLQGGRMRKEIRMKKPTKTVLNMDEFPRKAHFEHFCTMASPVVGITAEVDVTDFYKYCKDKGYSFYLGFVHVAALAANLVPELRQRISVKKTEGDAASLGIVEYSFCPTSHTESTGDGRYCYCTLYHDKPFDEYMAYALEERRKCRERCSIEDGDDADSMLFVSCVPWLHYSQVIQPTNGPLDSNPRLAWGKVLKNFEGKLMMPLTVLAHHGLVDGIHIARFFEEVERALRELTEK